MHKEGGHWRYTFLYLDVQAPVPQQVGAARGQGGSRLLRSAAALHPRTGAAGGQCQEGCRCPSARRRCLPQVLASQHHTRPPSLQVVLVRPGQTDTDY